ncbi:unnamed protein product [Owenia fusiformis]|uniref:Meteorin-like protein n=1 Tax=Owenia fusiformis TaxID=6347 RepID=A0A8S4PQ10_OWEFU|nr:unnamed protein product [Owenia fusiformis]
MDLYPYLHQLWCMLVVFIIAPCIKGQFNQDQCDWMIRDDTEEKGIRNVFGTCSEGEVTWLSPYGALRLVLQYGGDAQTDFRGCITTRIEFTTIKISQEGKYNLNKLAILNITHPETERELCFDSVGGKIVLYIEADTDDHESITLGKAFINYDLERRFNHLSYDELIDCRPCSDEEILKAYCTSDFVVVGSMDKLFHDVNTNESELSLSVAKIIRQKSQRFKRTTNEKGRYHGSVIAPLKCNIRKGEGNFIFMGKLRLGRAILHCAPRLSQWEELKKIAIKNEDYICDLEN